MVFRLISSVPGCGFLRKALSATHVSIPVPRNNQRFRNPKKSYDGNRHPMRPPCFLHYSTYAPKASRINPTTSSTSWRLSSKYMGSLTRRSL